MSSVDDSYWLYVCIHVRMNNMLSLYVLIRYMYVGSVYLTMKDIQRARESFDSAISLSPQENVEIVVSAGHSFRFVVYSVQDPTDCIRPLHVAQFTSVYGMILFLLCTISSLHIHNMFPFGQGNWKHGGC